MGSAYACHLLIVIVSRFAVVAFALAMMYVVCLRGCAGLMVWSVVFAMLVAGGGMGFGLLSRAEEAKRSVEPDRADTLQGVGYSFLVVTLLFSLVVLAARKRILIAIEVVKHGSRAVTSMICMLFFPLVPLGLAVG